MQRIFWAKQVNFAGPHLLSHTLQLSLSSDAAVKSTKLILTKIAAGWAAGRAAGWAAFCTCDTRSGFLFRPVALQNCFTTYLAARQPRIFFRWEPSKRTLRDVISLSISTWLCASKPFLPFGKAWTEVDRVMQHT